MGQTEARLFYCRIDDKTTCRTTDKVAYCRCSARDIPSRIAMGPERPEFILFAKSDWPPQTLLQTFGPSNNYDDTLLQTMMDHSCQTWRTLRTLVDRGPGVRVSGLQKSRCQRHGQGWGFRRW